MIFNSYALPPAKLATVFLRHHIPVDAAMSERCRLAHRFEAGVHERVVVIEFDSVAAAIAAVEGL